MLFHYLTLYRTLRITGYLGAGKTALAVHLADRLLAAGFAARVVSNITLTGRVVAEFGDWKEALSRGLRDTVILYDESWIELGQGVRQARVLEYMAWLRKDNAYLLMPSTHELTPLVSQLQCERVFNGLMFGIPVWRWAFWQGRSSKKTRQYWLQWYPQRVFPLYDTKERPGAWRLYEWGALDDNKS